MTIWREYLSLRRATGAPPKGLHEDETRVYADSGGALRTIQPDGTDAAVGGGGGGSQPNWTVDGEGQSTYAAPNDVDHVIEVNVGDTGTVSGNGYVIRVFDQATGQEVWDIDVWGSLLMRPTPGGSGGLSIQSPSGQFLADTTGKIQFEATTSDSRFLIDNAFYAGDLGGTPHFGVFGSLHPQVATPVTLADVIALLQAYGLSA